MNMMLQSLLSLYVCSFSKIDSHFSIQGNVLYRLGAAQYNTQCHMMHDPCAVPSTSCISHATHYIELVRYL